MMMIGRMFSLAAVCCCGVLLTGCVTKEKFEAEKARALNFQRLLVQEEKRTGELDSELKRLRRDVPELEARNRELTAQLQAVREQMGRLQEEAMALREAASLKASEERSRPSQTKPKPSPKSRMPKAEAPTSQMSVPELSKPEFSKADTLKDDALRGDMESPIYHEVKPGETLFRISRQYGVDVKKIKEWNNLHDDLIEVGQKLVVGYQ